MRKIRITVIMILCILLTGCEGKVYYFKNASIENDSLNQEHNFYWAFQNKNEKNIRAKANFDIIIVNDKNETVYEATKSVTEEDYFERYFSLVGSITIKDDEIQPGNSSKGKICFRTYYEGRFEFEERSLPVNGLPVKQPEVALKQSLPLTVHDYDFYGKVENTFEIHDIKYNLTFEDYSDSFVLELQIYGERVSGKSADDNCYFYFNVVDSNGYVVEKRMEWTDRITKGEKFVTDKAHIYNLQPGEQYYIEITEYRF